MPSISELDTLVIDVINTEVGNKDEFTAYSITTTLRTNNPDIEINLHEVRTLVRAYMTNLPAGYDVYMKDWNGSQAITYGPASMTPLTIAVSTPAQITDGNPLTPLLTSIGMQVPWDDKDDNQV